MRTHAAEIADFYHQLALLLKSELPLPGGLRQLGRNTRSPQFARALEEIATLTGRGINEFVHYWIGDEGNGPYLQQLSEKESQ